MKFSSYIFLITLSFIVQIETSFADTPHQPREQNNKRQKTNVQQTAAKGVVFYPVSETQASLSASLSDDDLDLETPNRKLVSRPVYTSSSSSSSSSSFDSSGTSSSFSSAGSSFRQSSNREVQNSLNIPNHLRVPNEVESLAQAYSGNSLMRLVKEPAIVTQIGGFLPSDDRARFKAAAGYKKNLNRRSEDDKSHSNFHGLQSENYFLTPFNAIQKSYFSFSLRNIGEENQVLQSLEKLLLLKEVNHHSNEYYQKYIYPQNPMNHILTQIPNDQLRSLDLSGSKVGPLVIQFIVNSFPGLESLDLSGTNIQPWALYTIHGPDSSLLSKLTRLKSLNLSKNWINGDLLISLSKISTLESLILQKIKTDETSLIQLNLLSQLKHLDLSKSCTLGKECPSLEVHTENSETPADPHPLDNDGHLFNKRDESSTWLGDVRFFSSFSKLETLNLNNIYCRTSISPVYSKLSSLKSLSVSRAWLPRNKWRDITKLHETLEYLDLGELIYDHNEVEPNSLMSDEEDPNAGGSSSSEKFFYFLSKLEKLKKLSISLFEDDVQINDPILLNHFVGKLTELEELDLRFTRISAAGVRLISEKFPKLKKLVLSNTSIPTENLAELGLENLTSLEYLDLSAITRSGGFNIEELEALQVLPHLRFLNVSGMGFENNLIQDLKNKPASKFKDITIRNCKNEACFGEDCSIDTGCPSSSDDESDDQRDEVGHDQGDDVSDSESESDNQSENESDSDTNDQQGQGP